MSPKRTLAAYTACRGLRRTSSTSNPGSNAALLDEPQLQFGIGARDERAPTDDGEAIAAVDTSLVVSYDCAGGVPRTLGSGARGGSGGWPLASQKPRRIKGGDHAWTRRPCPERTECFAE